jgi:hypothetical protein
MPATIGAKALAKRPAPLPPEIKKLVRLLVRGNEETGERLDFFAAARAAGVQAHRARWWNDRSTEFQQAIRAEHKAFIRDLASSNGLVLKDLRDRSANGMVRLGAIKQIQELNAEAAAHAAAPAAAVDRFVINVVSHSDRPSAVTIDSHPIMPVAPHPWPSREPVAAMPAPEPPSNEPVFEPEPEPIFKPRRGYEDLVPLALPRSPSTGKPGRQARHGRYRRRAAGGPQDEVTHD